MKPFNVICKACLRKVFFAGCLSLLISANLFSQFDGKVFISSIAQNVKPFYLLAYRQATHIKT